MLFSATRIFLKFLPRSRRTSRYIHLLNMSRLEAAARTLASGIDSQAALEVAIELAPVDHLRKLLHSGATPARTAIRHPLILARRSKLDSAAKLALLLAMGADVNGFTGPRRFKLLNWAILNRDHEFFNFLMKSGIDIHSADRTGLLPLQASQWLEESGFEKRLKAEGAKEMPYYNDRLLESLLINENPLLSELHELIKWCVRNGGFETARFTLPCANMLRYRIHYRDARLKIELQIQSNEEITLCLFEAESILPFSSLLPPFGKIDSQSLRGHAVTVLTKLRKQIEAGSFRAEAPKSAPLASPKTEKALQTLGLNPCATELEIISAYRKLAKRYHPDVASGSQNQMVDLNRAYETLRK